MSLRFHVALIYLLKRVVWLDDQRFFFRHEKKPSCFGDNESTACDKGLQPSSGCIQACKSSQCHRGVAVHPPSMMIAFSLPGKEGGARILCSLSLGSQ